MPSSERFKNNTDHTLIIKIGNREYRLSPGKETPKMDYCGPDWVDSTLLDEIKNAKIYVEFPDNERILIETTGKDIYSEQDSKPWYHYLYFNFSYHFCKRINQNHIQKVVSEKKDKDKNRDAEKLVVSGNELFQKGKYKDAIKEYELAVEMTSDNKKRENYRSFKLLALAKINLSNGEFVDAINSCKEAINLNTSDTCYDHLAVVFLEYGDYLLSQKKYIEAIDKYEEAKKVAKSSTQKENCLQKLADAEKAKEEQELEEKKRINIMDNDNSLKQHRITKSYNLQEDNVIPLNFDEKLKVKKNSDTASTDTDELLESETKSDTASTDTGDLLESETKSDTASTDTDELLESETKSDTASTDTDELLESETKSDTASTDTDELLDKEVDLADQIENLYQEIEDAKTEEGSLALKAKQNDLIFQYNSLSRKSPNSQKPNDIINNQLQTSPRNIL